MRMRTPPSRFRRPTVARCGLLLALLAGCSASFPETRIVCGSCEEPDRFVRLQAAPSSAQPAGPGAFSHPLSLSPQEWGLILDSVKVQNTTSIFLLFTKREPDQPAFRPEDRAILSGMLSKAFAQAQPGELVVFGLTEREATGVMKMTTGGWFAREGELHLVLANHGFAVTMDSIRERLVADPLRPATGRTFEVSAGTHQRVVKDGRLIQRRLDPDPVEVAIAVRPLLAGATKSVTTTDSPPSDRASMEERLDRLKRLRETGRITEEEYQQKRKELLGQL